MPCLLFIPPPYKPLLVSLLGLISFFLLSISTGAQTATFNYTGSQQTYTVPSNVCFIEVDVRGAEGRATTNNPGGNGGRVQAIIPVTAGEILNIYVGEQPNSATGGWNDGGDGGVSTLDGDGGGGGGGSDIRQGGTGLSDRVVVGGGGGGGGCYSSGSLGGDGGGLTGEDGGFGGGGGTQTGGGSGGSAWSGDGPGAPGTSGAGGDGFNSDVTGGGGGGYYGGGGGGGGQPTSCWGFSGGGGSNYTDPGARAVEHTRGYQSGNGQIIITPLTGVSTPAAIYGDTIGCIGDTAIYTVEVPEANTYNWSFPPGVSIDTGQGTNSVVVTYDSLTSGTIEVTAANACHTSSPVTVNLTVVAPEADAGADTTICLGDSALLHVSSPPAGGYAWSPASALNDPDSATTWAGPSSTTTYSVTVTYNEACAETDDVEVRVLPLVDAGKDALICTGDSARLQASGGVNYAWNPATGLNDTAIADPWASPADTTTYTVVVTDSIGCTDMDSTTVYMVSSITPEASPDTTLCGGDTVQLIATGGSGYSWRPSAGLSDTTVADPQAAPSDTTEYIVTVSSGVCTPAADTVTVNVVSTPSPPSVSPTDTTICSNTSALLTVTDSAAFDQIIWYEAPAGGNGLDTANTLTTPPLTTTTTYYVAGENEFGYLYSLVGPADNTIGGGNGYSGSNSYGLVFDVVEECRLEEVAVHPESSGTVDIELQDAGGNVLQSTSVSVTVSSAYERVVIPVGFDLSPGANYRLMENTPGMTLYYNFTGLSYPYTMPEDWVTITSASTGSSGQYFYFYDWTVRKIGAVTCASTRAGATVTIPTPADAGPDATICAGDSARLTASDGVSYSWSPTTGLSDPAIADPWANPSDTTTYTVEVTDSIGCTTADSVTVFVTNALNANAEGDTTICAGESAPLMATGGTGYAWSPAAGLSCTNCQSPTASPAITTTYVVMVSSGACTPATDTVKVTVQAPPADAGADQAVCEADSVQLNASGGESYAWSPTTGLSDPTAANPWAASPVEEITYTVTVTDASGCTATDATTVTTLLPPEAGFSFDITDHTIKFTDASAYADSYDWDFGDDNTSSEAAPEDHTYEAPGDYDACLTVSNTCGSDTHCETIVITSVPGSLSEQPSVRVYPNPAGMYVTVEITGIAGSEVFELHMYSMEGRQVNPPVEIGREQQQARAHVDVSSLAKGFYLIRVVGESYTLNEKVYVIE